MSRGLRSVFGTALAGAAVLALGGCGPAGPSQKGLDIVYTSVVDCTEDGKADFNACSKAIDRAVSEHIKSGPKHVTLADCEAVEGYDRCEKHAERVYRPRIMGYLVSIRGEAATAKPLYGALKGAIAFRTIDGAVYDHQRTEGVTFSHASIVKVSGLFVDPKSAKAKKKS